MMYQTISFYLYQTISTSPALLTKSHIFTPNPYPIKSEAFPIFPLVTKTLIPDRQFICYILARRKLGQRAN